MELQIFGNILYAHNYLEQFYSSMEINMQVPHL